MSRKEKYPNSHVYKENIIRIQIYRVFTKYENTCNMLNPFDIVMFFLFFLLTNLAFVICNDISVTRYIHGNS